MYAHRIEVSGLGLPAQGQAHDDVACPPLPSDRRDAPHHRPALDGSRTPSGGQLHEAHRGGVRCDDHLAAIRSGTAPGLIRTGVTVSVAADEWLRATSSRNAAAARPRCATTAPS